MTMVMTMVRRGPMRIIKASEFKAKCLALMDEVARTGERIVITKNGKPVAELVAPNNRPGRVPGMMKGKIVIRGDIMAPAADEDDWEALK
jgi:prevent-host-death family protein